MHADLSLGLDASLWTVLVLTAIYSFIYWFHSLMSFDVDDLLLFAGVILSTAASVACVCVPTINLIANIRDNTSFHEYQGLFKLIRAEFASGVFPLRVTATVVGLQAVASLWKLGFTSAFSIKAEEWKRLFEFPETAAVPELPPLPAYRNRYAQYLLNVTQCGFYEAAIIILWWCNREQMRVPATAALAWLLFYIVDDWRIMNHYSTAFKGRLIRRHVRQLWLTNAVIWLLSAYCAFRLSWFAVVAYALATYAIIRVLLLLLNGVVGKLLLVNAMNWPLIYQRYDQTTGLERPTKAG